MRWLLLVAVVLGCASERAPAGDAAIRRDDDGQCYKRCLDVCTLPEQTRICQDGCDRNGEPALKVCAR